MQNNKIKTKSYVPEGLGTLPFRTEGLPFRISLSIFEELAE